MKDNEAKNLDLGSLQNIWQRGLVLEVRRTLTLSGYHDHPYRNHNVYLHPDDCYHQNGNHHHHPHDNHCGRASSLSVPSSDKRGQQVGTSQEGDPIKIIITITVIIILLTIVIVIILKEV